TRIFTMLKCLLAPLLETFRPHFDLSKTRLETLAVLLVGLANLMEPFPLDWKEQRAHWIEGWTKD
ncbi:MAG: hypothetical protein LC676_14275, partial [Loktanella sp.]|nr:hypothetical protein [Loktanella sp.]